jgi:hypothetical protein
MKPFSEIESAQLLSVIAQDVRAETLQIKCRRWDVVRDESCISESGSKNFNIYPFRFRSRHDLF